MMLISKTCVNDINFVFKQIGLTHSFHTYGPREDFELDEEYKELISSGAIASAARNYTFSEEFLIIFADKFTSETWKVVSRYQELTSYFIQKYDSKVDYDLLFLNPFYDKNRSIITELGFWLYQLLSY